MGKMKKKIGKNPISYNEMMRHKKTLIDFDEDDEEDDRDTDN